MDADQTSQKLASKRGSLTIEAVLLLGALVLILASVAKRIGGSEGMVAPPPQRTASVVAR